MSALPESHPAPERDAYTLGQMAETGLLWLVNRVVFHPRGFALALDYGDGEDEPRGWSIVAAEDGLFSFGLPDQMEHDRKAAIERLLAEALEFGYSPRRTERPS